jgi:hypothetical protein
VPTPILIVEEFNSCFTLLDKLERGEIRPEYVILYEFTVGDNFFAYEACMAKFKELSLYDLEKTFVTDLGEKSTEKFKHYRRKRFLYKLKSSLKPY